MPNFKKTKTNANYKCKINMATVIVAMLILAGCASYSETPPGLYFRFWPISDRIYYDVTVKQINFQFSAYSIDAQNVQGWVTIQYQLNAAEDISVAEQYDTISMLEQKLQSIMMQETQNVIALKSAMEIVETRAFLSQEIHSRLAEIAPQFSVSITAVTLEGLQFSAAFEHAVEQRMIAEQEMMQANFDEVTSPIETESLAGFIKIQDNTLYITPVDVYMFYDSDIGFDFFCNTVSNSIIWIETNDMQRLETYGLTSDEFPSGHHIRPNWPDVEKADVETVSFEINEATEFVFVDNLLIFDTNPYGNRQRTTNSLDEFLQYLFPSVVHFIEVHDGRVVRLVQEFGFTM